VWNGPQREQWKESVRSAQFPARLLTAFLMLSACVDPEERASESADLRDPWTLPTPVNDPTRAAGKQVFASCASCHLADASGRADGTIPRLAGQPAAILERRLRVLADGSDDLPVMTPFARALTELERRQVAAYLASLPRPTRVSLPELEPPGFDSGPEAGRGAAIYAERCHACHAIDGMGQPTLNAPRLCGQHEAYVLRRLREMAGTGARAGDPAMNAVAAALSADDRRAVSEHLARLRCE
jgi:cytochrome c553